MTDSTGPSRSDSHKEFGSLIADDTAARRRPRRWVLPTMTGTLAVLGAAALVAAALASAGGTASASTDSATRTTAATTDSLQTPSIGAPVEAATVEETPIAELADPDWITRIAAAGNIPERALAAYAGAAIAVASSDPGCGIGWNTLAAIGYVESEHGSMNGATVGDDGTVTSPIIGATLDGSNDTASIKDTDDGELDGDAQWDHAVGPFQFVPSTWVLTAQDGNRDGQTDVNQIDDAALAAAVHLCHVGGDLTLAENWIAAVSAYNDSAEYNNRVAEAANHYAKLK